MMKNKIKYTFLLIVLWSFCLNGISQNQSMQLLEQIIENNQELKLAKAEVERMQMESKIGIVPNNPEIEFGYLWGNDVVNGNRKDFSIKQSFDFPTAYSHRVKLSKLKGNHAMLYYYTVQQKLLMESVQIMLELVYKNKQLQLLKERLENVKLVDQMTHRMFKEGEVGRIETDKASLQHINLLSEYELCASDIEVLLSDLKILNGGKPIQYTELNYPEFLKVEVIDDLYKSFIYDDMAIVNIQSEIDLTKQEIKLSKSEYLPEFSISYMSENIRNEQFKGIRGGISIPLWQKRNTVKHAKIALNTKEIERLYEIQRKESNWEKYLGLYHSRSARLNKMSEILERITPYKSLLMAFELGEISLLNYITESTFYYQSEDSFLKLELEMYHALAELLKVDVLQQIN